MSNYLQLLKHVEKSEPIPTFESLVLLPNGSVNSNCSLIKNSHYNL